jgi:Flp pilus assembly protein TadG
VTAAPPPRRWRGLRSGVRWGGERGGSASVEAAIGAVALIALLTFGLAVGRLTAAEAAVTEAAHAAARLGSAVRDPAAARGQATTEADRVLGRQGIACAELTVTVDVPVTPTGQPSTATAQVRCTVRWADLALPGLPGRHDVSAVFTSSIDRYRERP